MQEAGQAAEQAAAAAAAAAEQALAAARAEGAAAELAAREAAAAEAEGLRRAVASAAAEKAELEAKVARAAGALRAADELRDTKCACCGTCNRVDSQVAALCRSLFGRPPEGVMTGFKPCVAYYHWVPFGMTPFQMHGACGLSKHGLGMWLGVLLAACAYSKCTASPSG